jgi:RHS repeat-associated protein
VSSITVNGSALLSNATYEPFGAIKGWSWGNGTSSTRSFDSDGRISQIANIETTNYAYDNASRITGISNANNSTLGWTYGYDNLDRLTSALTNGSSYGWTYDANGNRLTQTGSLPWTLNTSATSNRLNSTSGTEARTYGYDASGNTLSYKTIVNSFNNRGRMKTAKVGSSTTTYVTNALGQRIKKSGGTAGTVLYMYDEAGHLIGEYSSTGALVQETVYLGDMPVATIRPGTPVVISYVHVDHLNAPTKVSRTTDNKLRWRWDHDPFGIVIPSQNPQSLGSFVYNLRYPGQSYDSETGLFYNYARDYDPQVGRYVESDPIGLNAGVNTYAYALNWPLKFVDPTGLQGVVGPNPGGPSSSPILPSTGGPGNMGPRPAYPDTTNSVKCAAECTSTASKGAKRCMSSCGFAPGGAALCRGGWIEWQSACLINCAGG